MLQASPHLCSNLGSDAQRLLGPDVKWLGCCNHPLNMVEEANIWQLQAGRDRTMVQAHAQRSGCSLVDGTHMSHEQQSHCTHAEHGRVYIYAQLLQLLT